MAFTPKPLLNRVAPLGAALTCSLYLLVSLQIYTSLSGGRVILVYRTLSRYTLSFLVYFRVSARPITNPFHQKASEILPTYSESLVIFLLFSFRVEPRRNLLPRALFSPLQTDRTSLRNN